MDPLDSNVMESKLTLHRTSRSKKYESFLISGYQGMNQIIHFVDILDFDLYPYLRA